MHNHKNKSQNQNSQRFSFMELQIKSRDTYFFEEKIYKTLSKLPHSFVDYHKTKIPDRNSRPLHE